MGSQFGSAHPYGSCTTRVGGVLCGWPRQEDGTCLAPARHRKEDPEDIPVRDQGGMIVGYVERRTFHSDRGRLVVEMRLTDEGVIKALGGNQITASLPVPDDMIGDD